MSIKTLPLLVLCLGQSVLWAQKYGDIPTLIDPFAQKAAVSSYEHIKLDGSGELQDAIVAYLVTQHAHFTQENTQPVLNYQRSSLGGEHYSFIQFYEGFEVFNSELKINLNKQREIISQYDNSYNTTNWPKSIAADAQQLEEQTMGAAIAISQGYHEAKTEEQAVLAYIEDKLIACKSIILHDEQTLAHRLYLVDRSQEILVERDLNRYDGRSLVTAKVFAPDPITTANQVLQISPYIDSSDADNIALNQERRTVIMDVFQDNNFNYYLDNDWVVITDFSSPNIDNFVFTSPDLDFTRSQPEFEAVNAYYHITRFNQYIRDSLGMPALSNFKIQVDPHGLNGQDNSLFTAGGNNPRLTFGEGGVDDAEDADVIIHEYGHALSYQASPGGNSGADRPAIDEGFGDYVAASYSRAYSSFRWDDVFTWDGHNENFPWGWNGRIAADTSYYSASYVNSVTIHTAGQLWASSLMEIWGILGREIADKLALQTLYSLSSGLTFPDAALAYLQADTLLYGGAHYNTIYPIFVNRRFLGPSVGLNNGTATATPSIKISNTEGFAYYNQPAVVTSTAPIIKLELYDLTGKLVYTENGNHALVNKFSVNNLPKGVYALRIQTSMGNTTHKLVKAN